MSTVRRAALLVALVFPVGTVGGFVLARLDAPDLAFQILGIVLSGLVVLQCMAPGFGLLTPGRGPGPRASRH